MPGSALLLDTREHPRSQDLQEVGVATPALLYLVEEALLSKEAPALL